MKTHCMINLKNNFAHLFGRSYHDHFSYFRIDPKILDLYFRHVNQLTIQVPAQ